MKAYIVLISVGIDAESRGACESIENFTLNIEDFPCNTLTALHVRNKLIEIINDEAINEDSIEVEPISDFMDRVNDECFNPDNYFMSYVYA